MKPKSRAKKVEIRQVMLFLYCLLMTMFISLSASAYLCKIGYAGAGVAKAWPW